MRASQRRFDERERDKGQDKRLYDAEAWPEKRLDYAEFSLLQDAGSEEADFAHRARLTTSDVQYLLRYEAIAVDSLFLHNETGIQ